MVLVGMPHRYDGGSTRVRSAIWTQQPQSWQVVRPTSDFHGGRVLVTNLIVMTASDFSDGTAERGILEPLGAELKIVHCTTEEEVIEAAGGAMGLLVTFTPIRRRAMTALPDLKIIARTGIGVDNLDLDAARDLGIRVCNVPDYCWDEVADHTMALTCTWGCRTPRTGFARAESRPTW